MQRIAWNSVIFLANDGVNIGLILIIPDRHFDGQPTDHVVISCHNLSILIGPFEVSFDVSFKAG